MLCYLWGLRIPLDSIRFPYSRLQRKAQVTLRAVTVIFLVPQTRARKSSDLPRSNKQSILSLVALDGFSLVTSDAT